MAHASLIIFMILAIILLFTSMVLSAMAASDAKKSAADCKDGCSKYSTWSAVVSGISVAVILVVLIIYIVSSRKDIAKAAQGKLGQAHAALGNYAGTGTKFD